MADRGLVSGISATALGILAVALAGLEYYVSVGVSAAGAGGEGTFLSQMTFGTGAYIVGYLAAGAILIAIGVCKIYRAVRGA